MTEQRSSRDQRISAAALDLLRTKGPAAVTVEAVVARSGVAKTTIYRRYRNRNDMLTAALASITQPPSPPNPSLSRLRPQIPLNWSPWWNGWSSSPTARSTTASAPVASQRC